WFTQNAYWLELVRPVMAIVLAYLFVFFYRYVDEERNKRYIKNMFQFYLTASVVDELLRRPELLKLGGERRVATAFFSDIKNFTTVSEKLSPESLVAQLNEYLSEMTDIVLKYEGYLDKYEGDAIMAIFGIPIEQHDHPSRAVLAALEMQDALVELRKKWRNEGKPELYARMGINTGPMIAGNIGGIRRFDYTVIGDAVNLASRLEGVNKTYGTGIIISEYTRIKLDDSIVVRELDKIRVKGKNEPVAVFQVLSKNRSHLLNAQLLILEDFEKGLLAYRKGQWDLALSIFQRVLAVNPNDGPARTFLKRCLYFQKNPVPQNWDGVFDMKTK
ncbi:adenylate/guanylate cyclase domain-containing protein, partial [candidate division KSB1 bacterium]|nr:adenylate/guanylate cyclase domain-containing protein [candidate division KSB1 bacterium]